MVKRNYIKKRHKVGQEMHVVHADSEELEQAIEKFKDTRECNHQFVKKQDSFIFSTILCVVCGNRHIS